MDGKTVAIGVLVVVAVFLGGVVASSLRQDAAYAQGGVYATYLAASVEVRDEFVNFAVLDTETRRIVFYDLDPTKFVMTPSAGRVLQADFQHKGS